MKKIYLVPLRKTAELKGFTLIEILVVVIIIGVLVGMAVTSYVSSFEKMRGAEAIEVLTKCYAGYQRLLMDDEEISASNPLRWSRLGMTNPNLNPQRFFNYSVLDSDASPRSMYADRIGQAGWLSVDLFSGCITKSSPY